MRSKIQIYSDGINVYATLEVVAAKIGIRILALLILIEVIVICFFLSKMESDDIPSLIIPLTLILVIFIGLPVKYLLWNLYGKEHLIVTTKSLSWHYDYGLIRTNIQTIIFNRLEIGFEKLKSEQEEEIGKLIFYNYRKDDNLPEVMHETTVLFSETEFAQFHAEISQIFGNEIDDTFFNTYSLN